MGEYEGELEQSQEFCYISDMKSFGPHELLGCYARGIFPMSDGRDDPRIFLLDPSERGIIPLKNDRLRQDSEGLHISRSMKKLMRRGEFHVTYNKAFARVIDLCAESADDRETTWINHDIEYLYTKLHHMGHAHSVEVWDKTGETLIGGLYGVSLGGAFFGESMFSRASNGSKIALIKLVEHLDARQYGLLDTQFLTDHLATMGAIEISRDDYQRRLNHALDIDTSFNVAINP